MIYENKILPRLSPKADNNSSDEILKLAGLDIMSFDDISLVEKSVRQESKKIITHYLHGSDLLQFLCSAEHHGASSLRYKLNPPITTSKLDCDFLLNSLACAGFVVDYSYSSLTTSFWIELNKDCKHSLTDILNVGVCELFERNPGFEIKYNVELRSLRDNIYADVIVISDRKITIISIELAAGLESNVSSHISQLKKLKSKIIKSEEVSNEYIAEYFLITPAVYRQLPTVLQQLEQIITIDNISSKLQSIEL